MCSILTSVQLLQNRRGIKQKLKLPIFGKTDKIARAEKNPIPPYLAFTHIIQTLKPDNIKGFCFSIGLIVFYVTELARSFDMLSSGQT